MTDTTFPTANLDNEPIHSFFGLSYCSHLVLPRVLLQSMPDDWQRKFVALLEEMQDAFAHVDQPQCYDVRSAVEKPAEELSPAELALTGATCEWDEDRSCDVYHDRDGDEIEAWWRVLVPVADPLPSYSRGRTRVPRADQLADAAGGY